MWCLQDDLPCMSGTRRKMTAYFTEMGAPKLLLDISCLENFQNTCELPIFNFQIMKDTFEVSTVHVHSGINPYNKSLDYIEAAFVTRHDLASHRHIFSLKCASFNSEVEYQKIT